MIDENSTRNVKVKNRNDLEQIGLEIVKLRQLQKTYEEK